MHEAAMSGREQRGPDLTPRAREGMGWETLTLYPQKEDDLKTSQMCDQGRD